jgi:hypothetical protein
MRTHQSVSHFGLRIERTAADLGIEVCHCNIATEPPITIASGQAELNLRKIASGHGEKRDLLHYEKGDISNVASKGTFLMSLDTAPQKILTLDRSSS